MTRTGGTNGTFRPRESMNAEDLAGTFQGVDSRLSRIEGIVQEMSHGITRLT
jgi:hypothetical protein